MRSGMWKSVIREIRGSLGRYFAILGIIALGSGFLSGLRISKSAMLETGNRYLSSRQFYDFRLISTLGFQQAQVEAVALLPGVKAAEGSLAKDILCGDENSSDFVLHCMSISDRINLPGLLAGRMPEKGSECLADSFMYSASDIGRTIRLTDSNDPEDLEAFAYDAYTIVGIASSPLYLNFERGTTSLGTGTVAGFLYIPPDGFDIDYYTDIYLTLQEGGYIYSDEYEAAVDKLEDAVTAACEEQAMNRYTALVQDAWEEIRDGEREWSEGREEYDREKADAEKKLAEAWQELLDAEAALEDGAAEIADGWAELYTKAAEGRQKLLDAEAALVDAKAELEDGERQYAEGLAALQDGEEEYGEGLAEWNRGYAEYEDGKKQYDDGLAQYNEGLKQYNEGRNELNAGGAQLTQARQQLDTYEEQYKGLTQLYALVSGIAASQDKTAGELIAAMEAAVADPTDADAATLLAAVNGALSDTGMTVEGLVGAWQQAETQLQAAGYGSTLDDSSLTAMRAALDQGWQQYEAGCAAYSAGYQKLTEAKKQLDENWAKLEEARKQLEEAKAALDEGEKALQDSRRKLDEGWAELEDSRRKLDEGWTEYNNGLQETANGWDTLKRETAEAARKLRDAERELAEGRQEYEDGLREYNEARAEADEKFADALRELTDGRKELDDAIADVQSLKAPKTYVLKRSENVGYTCFDSDSSIVGGIARVFPLFFFLVAALVCVTTMTRMVDEQRTQIGTLKALGYGKGSIMGKYLLYSGSAALFGCLLGVSLGSYVFPLVIWKAYNIMYRFSDKIVYIFDPLLAAAVVASFLLCTLAATWYSCNRELSEVPAELIRPRAPKSGKRTLLERIPLLWNRLGFFGKVSARNIVRYRQRLFMMVIGIGGCMALLITGFGIQDSIRDIVNYQFEEITLYDGTVTFSDELSEEDKADFLEACGEVIGEAVFLHTSSADISANGLTKSASLLVSDGADLGPFIDLHRGDEKLAMPGAGEAVINDGLAAALHLSVGDSIILRNGDMEPLEVRIAGIFDNYVFNYCILDQATCLEQWGHHAPVKSAYVNFPDGADGHAAAAAIMDCETVGGVSVTADLRGRVSSMLSSIRYINLLIVLCAGSLAFIVQYNLTNININERIREIATIKVIGFYPREAADYVFRETRTLTGIGALAGIPLGILLHRFVISQITIDLMRFDVRIKALSYLYCLALTFLFSIVVDFFMFRRIRDINMAESLKSVE